MQCIHKTFCTIYLETVDLQDIEELVSGGGGGMTASQEQYIDSVTSIAQYSPHCID